MVVFRDASPDEGAKRSITGHLVANRKGREGGGERDRGEPC